MKNSEPKTEKYSSQDKKWLLNLARKSILAHLQGDSNEIPEPPSPILNNKRAVFVTLHQNGELRGCIGHMLPRWGLARAIWEMSASAAFQDPRFPPLTARDLPEISLEISILSPMKKITNLDEIIMGRDGVMVQQGIHSGVYLPQVARETGWSKTEFLTSLCSSKAMLPPKAYLDPQTDIFTFEVIEFKEDK